MDTNTKLSLLVKGQIIETTTNNNNCNNCNSNNVFPHANINAKSHASSNAILNMNLNNNYNNVPTMNMNMNNNHNSSVIKKKSPLLTNTKLQYLSNCKDLGTPQNDKKIVYDKSPYNKKDKFETENTFKKMSLIGGPDQTINYTNYTTYQKKLAKKEDANLEYILDLDYIHFQDKVKMRSKSFFSVPKLNLSSTPKPAVFATNNNDSTGGNSAGNKNSFKIDLLAMDYLKEKSDSLAKLGKDDIFNHLIDKKGVTTKILFNVQQPISNNQIDSAADLEYMNKTTLNIANLSIEQMLR